MTEMHATTDAVPLRLHAEHVRPEWVDYNGHMNVAYYVLVFDHATDAVLDHLDIGTAYREATGCSVFVAEMHVTYEDEALEGERLEVESRLSGFDGKRIILFHEMRNARGAVIASNEVLCLSVNLATRRTAPLPAAAIARVEELARAHAALPPPAQAGRAVSLSARRPRTAT